MAPGEGENAALKTVWQKLLEATAAPIYAAVGTAVFAGVVFGLLLTFDGIRAAIETDTYTIESINRQAFPAESLRILLKASLNQSSENVWIADESWCNNPGSDQPDPRQADAPAGTFMTLSYVRSPGTKSITFDAGGGAEFVFVGSQGDEAPARVCFNELRNRITITYDATTPNLDTAQPGRVLFVQMNEPAANIASSMLRDRSYVYMMVVAITIAVFVVFLLALLVLIWWNGQRDESFRRKTDSRQDASERQMGALSLRISAIDEQIDELSKMLERVSTDQDSTKADLIDKLNEVQRILTDTVLRSASELSSEKNPRMRSIVEELSNKGFANATRHSINDIRNVARRTISKPVPSTAPTTNVDRLRSMLRGAGGENT